MNTIALAFFMVFHVPHSRSLPFAAGTLWIFQRSMKWCAACARVWKAHRRPKPTSPPRNAWGSTLVNAQWCYHVLVETKCSPVGEMLQTSTDHTRGHIEITRIFEVTGNRSNEDVSLSAALVNLLISESSPPVTALDDATRHLYVSAVSYRYAEVESRKNWS